MTDKIWWTKIRGTIEGPFSCYELKRDKRITPDTLVRKTGEVIWQPIRYVKELEELFEDEENEEIQEPSCKDTSHLTASSEMVLTLNDDEPPPILPWLLILGVIILYLIYTLTI